MRACATATSPGGVIPRSSAPSGPADDLLGFLRFAGRLWALLAGVSVLFPLANVFLRVIPASERFQPLFRLPPAVMAPAAMLASAFMLLVSYYGRTGTDAARTGVAPARRSALTAFLAGAVCLGVYLSWEALLGDRLYGDTANTTIAKEAALEASDIAFILLYSGFFVFMTRAFVILALLEYRRPTHDSQPKANPTA
jgi:hypothetical protein